MRSRDFHKMKAKKCHSRVHWDKIQVGEKKSQFRNEEVQNCPLLNKIRDVSLAKRMKKNMDLINNLMSKGRSQYC